jgi:hypothetical protein
VKDVVKSLTPLYAITTLQFEKDVSCHTYRGVRTGGARKLRPTQVFGKHKKSPFSGGEVPYAFVKNVVQVAVFL